MTDQQQLFTDLGRVTGTAAFQRKLKNKRACRVPGCDKSILHGGGHCYCGDHECDYDTCYKLVVERGRCRVHAYCQVDACPNMRRQASAAKYCDDHATCIDYELRQTVPFTTTGVCLICDQPVTQRRAVGERRSLLLCRDHRHLRVMLAKWRSTYNLEDERIRELLREPRCWVDGGDLSWRFANWQKSQAALGNVHVDHDHRCCPGDTSCGNCVRGLTHQACNRRLGQLEAMIKDLGAAQVIELVTKLEDRYTDDA